MREFAYYTSTAVTSGDALYRYTLVRVWDTGKPRLVWVMLNPSTADARFDDPTIRRCVGRAARHEFGSIEVVNLFAYRSTNPRGLLTAIDPVGPNNDQYIVDAFGRADELIVAWGSEPARNERLWDRVLIVEGMIRESGLAPRCLGVTRDGCPKHPLYLSYNLIAEPYPLTAEEPF